MTIQEIAKTSNGRSFHRSEESRWLWISDGRLKCDSPFTGLSAEDLMAEDWEFKAPPRWNFLEALKMLQEDRRLRMRAVTWVTSLLLPDINRVTFLFYSEQSIGNLNRPRLSVDEYLGDWLVEDINGKPVGETR